MCRTVRIHYLGCSDGDGPTHTTTATVECALAKTCRSNGSWFDCRPRPLTVWQDTACTICGKTPTKKLARVLKNPVHMLSFFGDKGVGIQHCEEASWGQDQVGQGGKLCIHGGQVIRRPVEREREREREVPLWETMQRDKIESALAAKAEASRERETPGGR